MKHFFLFFFFLLTILNSGFAQRLEDLEKQSREKFSQSQFLDARPLAERALGLSLKKYGPKHPGYLKNLLLLARIDEKLGNYSMAEEGMLNALNIVEKSRGSESLAYAGTADNLATLYDVMGQYSEAEELYLKALSIREKLLGKTHPDYGQSLNGLALLYMDLHRYNEAAQLLVETEKIVKTKIGTKNEIYAVVLNNLGGVYLKTGEVKKAETTMLQTRTLTKEILGENHPLYGTTLNNLGLFYTQLGKFEEAEPLLLESLKIAERTFGKNHSVYAGRLLGMAQVYKDLHLYDKSLILCEQAISIFLIKQEKSHPDFSAYLNTLAIIHQGVGNYSKADSVYDEIGKTIVKLNLKGTILEATFEDNRGGLYKEWGKYDLAENAYLKGKRIREKQIGPKHPSYAKSLQGLAGVYLNMGKYDKIESLCLEAMGIYEKTYGPSSDPYLETYRVLANYYREVGAYMRAERTFHTNLSLVDKYRGKESLRYANLLNDFALFYDEMGNYSEAEKLLIEASRLDEKIVGTEHSLYIGTLTNLGNLYSKMGRDEEATKTYEEAYSIGKKVYGDQSTHLAVTMQNLAYSFAKQRKYEKAVEYSLEAVRTFQTVIGSNSIPYAESLEQLAGLREKMGEFDKAIELYERSLAIKEKVLGKNHPDFAISMSNYSGLLLKLKEYEKVEVLYKQAHEILAGYYGPNHPNVAAIMENRAKFYWAQGKPELARHLLDSALTIERKHFSANLEYLSEGEKAKFFASNEASFEFGYNFGLSPYADHEFIQRIFNLALFQKSLLLRSEVQLRNAIRRENSPEVIEKYEELKRIKRKWSNVILQPISEQKEDPNSLFETSVQIEKELNKTLSGYFQPDIDWSDIQKKLGKRSAVIEFVHFLYYNGQNFTDSIMYAAFVVRKEDAFPHLVPLGWERELVGLFQNETYDQDFINSIYRGVRVPTSKGQDLSAYKGRINKFVWSPLDSFFQSTDTIYYAPSGFIHNLSFSAIPIGDKLLSDQYTLVRMNTTGDLVRKDIPLDNLTKGNIAAFGGLNYNLDNGQISRIAQKFLSDSNSGPRHFESISSRSRGDTWRYLKGTLDEVNLIDSLGDQKGWAISVLQGDEGLEDVVKTLTGGEAPDILHFATHGFYYSLPKGKIIPKNAYNEEKENASRYQVLENPLFRSGLVFAGANGKNRSAIGSDEVDDGILTAYEVSDLDLSKTRLVVLSACETGLGDIKGNEGVYGLQRGFKKAGVRYLLMSLWKVPDRETVEFMSFFYQRLLSKNSIVNSFHYAQASMKDKYPDQPYLWAGFVLME